MKTILITGSSSGIGRTTAKLFQERGWNVVATMRHPEQETELNELDNVLVSRLDVTDGDSIATAVDEAVSRFGKIDVLLNNAGYGAYGPLEAFPMDRIERQFDTNVIGLLAVTKAVLPHLRQNRCGVIVNISSIGGQITFPLGTLYHGTKFAVEGLSEALHYELSAFGVQVKIVQPGMIRTEFSGRSFDFMNDAKLIEYQETVEKLFGLWRSLGANASDPDVVAEVIWRAATDGTYRLRYRAGADAKAFLEKRKAEEDETFIGDLKAQLG
ncbi:MAG: SDR family oxidoreductase [Methyloceanibacter sp.]|nr:SDR family oxidoreductase [Methyloceanibacter sp.]